MQSVGFNLSLPLRTHWQSGFDVEGRAPFAREARPSIEVGVADADYFRTMGLPILRGRNFDTTDLPGAPRRIIIEQRMADEFWPGENPVGKAILWGDDPKTARTEIVGVVPSIGMNGYTTFTGPKLYQLYFAQTQTRAREMYAVIRTSGEPRGVLDSARAVVAAMDPDIPLYEIATMEEILGENTSAPRLTAALLQGFSGAALVLACLGIYGVVSHQVRSRRREIGLRLAIGAPPQRVVTEVLQRNLWPLALGLLLGLCAAAGIGFAAQSQLFGVSPSNPTALATAVGVLLGSAALALWWPARQAARIDPLATLRSE